MPEQAPLTPEENLLRIIESPKDAVRSMRPRPRVNFDVNLSLKMMQVKYGDKVKKLATLKSLNLIFLAFGLVATFYMFVDFWAGMPKEEAMSRLETSAKAAFIGDLNVEQLKPEEAYAQEITSRNIFALSAPPPAVPATAVIKPNPVIEDIITAYRLVGIIWSESPQAILEDTKTNSTTLVNRGSDLKGARIKDILKDRVILSYDNKDIELR
jgi:hypothetical protein